MTYPLTNAQKTTKVKKHYLAALYHSVFYDRDSTQIMSWAHNDGVKGVSNDEAQILIAGGCANLRVSDDGRCYLNETIKGSKVYGGNATLYGDYRGSDGKVPVLSTIPRYQRDAPPVDIRAVRDACMAYHRTWSLRKMY